MNPKIVACFVLLMPLKVMAGQTVNLKISGSIPVNDCNLNVVSQSDNKIDQGLDKFAHFNGVNFGSIERSRISTKGTTAFGSRKAYVHVACPAQTIIALKMEHASTSEPALNNHNFSFSDSNADISLPPENMISLASYAKAAIKINAPTVLAFVNNDGISREGHLNIDADVGIPAVMNSGNAEGGWQSNMWKDGKRESGFTNAYYWSNKTKKFTAVATTQDQKPVAGNRFTFPLEVGLSIDGEQLSKMSQSETLHFGGQVTIELIRL